MTDPHIVRREEVMAYLDGELAGERAEEARAHLASCAECAALAGGWQKTSAALAAWQVEPSPDRLAARVLDAAAKRPGESRASGAWSLVFAGGLSKWSLVAASIAAVTFTSVVVSRMGEKTEPTLVNDTLPEAAGAPATAAAPPAASEPAPPVPGAADRDTRSGLRQERSGATSPRRAAADAKKTAGRPAEAADAAAQGQSAANVAAVPQPTTAPPPPAVSAAPPPPPPPPPASLPPAAPPPAAATMSETIAKPPVAAEAKPTPPVAVGQGRGGGGGRGAGLAGGLGYVQAPAFRSAADAPAIVRNADLSVVVERFDDARPAIERIVKERAGQIASLDVATEPANRRTIQAMLRIPVASYQAALSDLRRLGKVSRESQSSDDISAAVRDLGARLTNARQQETRLRDLLQRRAELSDVLAVERELARVRTDIERMEAEARANADRVALATITLRVEEGYRAALLPESDSVGRRMSNAFIDGCRIAFDRVVGLMIGFLQVAPTVTMWVVLAIYPYRVIRRRMRIGPRGAGVAA